MAAAFELEKDHSQNVEYPSESQIVEQPFKVPRSESALTDSVEGFNVGEAASKIIALSFLGHTSVPLFALDI